MKLYSSKTSPFARRVRVVLREIGLEKDIEEVFVGGSPVDPGSMPVDHNPLGKIPTLILPDGEALFDSRVICRYLSDVYWPEGYPRGLDAWRALALEAIADGMMEAALLCVYEQRLRPEPLRYAPWVEGQWVKIERALESITTHYFDILEGPVAIPVLAVAVALEYLDFRHGHRDWQARHTVLAAWKSGISTRISLASTRPSD